MKKTCTATPKLFYFSIFAYALALSFRHLWFDLPLLMHLSEFFMGAALSLMLVFAFNQVFTKLHKTHV